MKNRETENRINQYSSRLPRLRERIVTASILLLIAVIMLTTVSFSWLTLSTNPEATNITTAIASNGTLEIALATGSRLDPTEPDASKIGDGNLPIVKGNHTWGNMINLSDPSYGLGNLVLRPAGLNTDDLFNSPLYGADYQETGRQEGFINSFRYAKWKSTNPDDADAPWEFVLSDELGVRAISSTKMAESSGYAYTLQIKIDEANKANTDAKNAYILITQNYDIITGTEKPFLEALATVMGAYMTANMNASQSDNEHLVNAEMEKEDMEAFRDLFLAFSKVLELEREAMLKLANLQLFVVNQGDMTKYNEFASVDALVAQKAQLKSMGLEISGLEENLSDAQKLQTNYEKLVAICQQGTIKWGDDNISGIVNALINVGTCTVNGTRVSSIGASAALDLNKKSCDTIITNGILYNFEKRTGARMNVPKGTTALESKYPKGLTVTAKGKRLGMEMDGTIYALITTNAPSPSQFQNDINYANSKNQGGTAQLSANDTYGFAIDFWVRTNAAGSFLTLQGNIITTTVEEDAKGKDKDGNEVQLYTVTVQTTDDAGEPVEYTFDVYMLTDENNEESWYYADSHEPYKNDASNPPKKKVNFVEVVTGYEGENRIWENNAFLSTDNTTQGSGSCYVYYADSPEDQKRSLVLLSAMNIAFVDQSGTLMAEGYMDTENCFVDNGKVIVPMRLSAKSIALENPDGSETLAITPLEQNVAKLVTAIVYLDGTKIKNKDVLAVSDIRGQLNIQFGSSVALTPLSDEELASKSMSVSVFADKTEFDYDTSVASGTPMTTNMTVKIEGYKPTKVTAFFVRAISATQGIPMNSEEELLVFTDRGGGEWTTECTFTSPGKYVLRSVQVDGVEYDLEPNARPQIEVKGFAVKNLSWTTTTAKEQKFMTAANSVSAEVSLEFVTNNPERMPTRVEGRFLRTDGNSVNVTFTRNATTNKWTGKATFLSSGTYTLEFLVFNGEYHAVDPTMQRVAEVLLGMKVAVYTDSPQNFLFGYGVDGDADNGMEDNERNLYMKVKIMDDMGNELYNLTDVKLYYAMDGYEKLEMGLNADVEWNYSSKYYEGAFETKVGVFKFLYVTVGDNTITTATTSPKFVIQSPTPPSFNEGNTQPYQYAPDYVSNPAKFSVYLNDSDGIENESMIGIITDGTNIYEIAGENQGDGNWNFKVPLNSNNTQDGTWTIEKIHIVGGYVDGEMRDAENPYVIDLAGGNNLTTTVLSTIKVSFDNTAAINKEGVFLQEHTLDAFGITISDLNNHALPEIIDTVTVEYAYQNDSVAKGGYSIGSPVSNPKLTLVKTAKTGKEDGTYFLQSADALTVLKHAGTYKLSSIHYSFKGGAITLTGESLPNAPVITVKSETPTVMITAAQYANKNGGTSSIANNGTSTTVYYKEGTEKACGITYYNYTPADVTITLTGYGFASGAKLEFTTNNSDGKVHLYEESQKDEGKATNPYSWTGDGACKRYMGYWESKTGTDEKIPAGTLTATELVLTDASGVKYVVDVPDITINNPS